MGESGLDQANKASAKCADAENQKKRKFLGKVRWARWQMDHRPTGLMWKKFKENELGRKGGLGQIQGRKNTGCKNRNSNWFQGDGDPLGLNPDLSVETKDNSIGEESRCSCPDYNHLGTLYLSDWYTNSHGQRDLVEHDNPTTRAPLLWAIEELARTSRTSTELQDKCEVY
jgi:hypothetical protein